VAVRRGARGNRRARPRSVDRDPAGTRFQFRADGEEGIEAVGVTMPPWPGMDEAYLVEGIWPATV